MTALWRFFVDEMRRNLPVLPVGLVAVGILSLPAVRDLSADAGLDDHRLLVAACVLFLLVPALSLYLAGNAWLRERAEGTLLWLYARPLPAGALFTVRLAAMMASVGLFAGLALLLVAVSPVTVITEPGLRELGVLPLAALLLVVVPAAAVWVSACAPARSWAGPLLFGAVAAAWVLPGVVRSLLPMPHRLFAHVRELDVAIAAVRYGVFPLLLLTAAWWATRRAVGDRRRRRLAMLATAAVAGAATAVLWTSALAVVWSDPVRPTWARSLTDGHRLRLVQGRGLEEGVAQVEITGVGRLPVFAFSFPFVAPDGRSAVVRLVTEEHGWSLVTAVGAVHALGTLGASPVGWSPGGDRFAFLCSPRRTVAGSLCSDVDRTSLLLVDRAGALRTVPLPVSRDVAFWNAEWLDGDHLLLAEAPSGTELETREGQRWGVVSVAGRTARWARPVTAPPPGRTLSTAFSAPRMFGGHPAPRRRGRLLLWIGEGEERTLASLEPTDWSLRPLTVRPRAASTPERWYHPESLGTLDDGTAVWLERDAGARRVMLLPPPAADGEPQVRASCRLPAGERLGGFLGAAGSRAAWSDRRQVLLCDLTSGEAEVLDALGAGPVSALGVEVTQSGVRAPDGRWLIGGPG